MKKKAVAALLAAGLSLNLCGCSAYGVAMKMMQDYEPEQSQDWAVEAQLPEEEEILESEESEETGNEDAEETVIAGKDQSEKTSVEMPEELSDNLYDFQIAMDGQVYKFPMWFDDFEALGWEYLGDRTEVLYANEYLYAEPWQKDGVTIYTSIANLSLNAIAPEEGQICGLDLDGYQMRNCDWKIELSKGITFGESAREDILKAYGEPTDEYDGELYYKMSYETDYYSEVTLYVYKDSGVMEKLELMNMIELEGLDNSVSEEVPELISEYKAPTQLGDDYYSNMQLSVYLMAGEGDLYALSTEDFKRFAAQGVFIDLTPYVESGALNVEGIDLSSGYVTLLDDDGNPTETKSLFGIPLYTLYGYMDGMGLDNRDLVIAVTTFSQNEENVIAFLNELIQSGRGDMPERLKQ